MSLSIILYLIRLRPYDQNGRIRCVTSDGAQPEIQSSMFETHSHIPHQHVHSSLGHEKLCKEIKEKKRK